MAPTVARARASHRAASRALAKYLSPRRCIAMFSRFCLSRKAGSYGLTTSNSTSCACMFRPIFKSLPSTYSFRITHALGVAAVQLTIKLPEQQGACICLHTATVINVDHKAPQVLLHMFRLMYPIKRTVTLQ